MKYKVIAVVVTCNRCELLKLSLNALFASAYNIEKIIVVNNASEDGTKEYLDTINNDKLLVIHKEVNEGGAGGFFYGIKEAYFQGCDFVWIMDDDTIITPLALNELINSNFQFAELEFKLLILIFESVNSFAKIGKN